MTVHFTPSSQLKVMPDMRAMIFGAKLAENNRNAWPDQRKFDPQRTLEQLPAGKLDELRSARVIVTSTKGAKGDELTAIMMLANADFVMMAQGSAKDASGASGMDAIGKLQRHARRPGRHQSAHDDPMKTALLFALLVPAWAQEPPHGTVRPFVCRRPRRVRAASRARAGASVKAGQSGEYSIPSLPPGKYQLRVCQRLRDRAKTDLNYRRAHRVRCDSSSARAPR